MSCIIIIITSFQKHSFSPSVYAFHRQPRLDKLHFNSEHFSFQCICAATSDFSFSAYSFLAIALQDTQYIFLEDCQDMLGNLATNHPENYICVYLSLNLDKPSSSTTAFDHILASFDFKQHIIFSTKMHGHLRCLVINRSNCNNI